MINKFYVWTIGLTFGALYIALMYMFIIYLGNTP